MKEWDIIKVTKDSGAKKNLKVYSAKRGFTFTQAIEQLLRQADGKGQQQA